MNRINIDGNTAKGSFSAETLPDLLNLLNHTLVTAGPIDDAHIHILRSPTGYDTDFYLELLPPRTEQPADFTTPGPGAAGEANNQEEGRG